MGMAGCSVRSKDPVDHRGDSGHEATTAVGLLSRFHKQKRTEEPKPWSKFAGKCALPGANVADEAVLVERRVKFTA